MSAATWIAGAGVATVVVAPMSIVLLFSPGSAAACDQAPAPPHEGAYSQQDVQALWMSQRGDPDKALIASAVAMAESSGDPGATSANPAGGTNLGLWQVWDGNAGATLDPAGNARAAIRLSHNGTDWRLWETFTNGDYLRFMGTPSPSGQPFDGPVSGAGCDAGVPGRVEIAPGANLPGKPLAPETMRFLARVAGLYGKPIVCTTGTNHSEYTVDGNVSDHFDGHACDLGMVANHGTDDGPVGDTIATACLTAAGDAAATAAREARAGGLWTRDHAGLRVQCIWKTNQGGNHHNHVHVGARRTT